MTAPGRPQWAVLELVLVYSVIDFVVDLPLTLTFLSLVFWTWVLGPIGAILAIPLTLLGKALLIDVDPESAWISTLLTSSTPEPVPEDG